MLQMSNTRFYLYFLRLGATGFGGPRSHDAKSTATTTAAASANASLGERGGKNWLVV